MGRAKTASRSEGQYSKEELQNKHAATLASKEAMREQARTKKELAMAAADQAKANYQKNPTTKNYRMWQTATTRAINS